MICDMIYDNLNEIYTKALCMLRYVFLSVETTRLGHEILT